MGFDFGEGASSGAVGTGVAECEKFLVGFVAADLALGFGDPLFEVFEPVVGDFGSVGGRWQAGVSVFDGLFHGVVGAAAQVCGGPQ